jgi:ATP-binding cassette subfamily C protein
MSSRPATAPAPGPAAGPATASLSPGGYRAGLDELRAARRLGRRLLWAAFLFSVCVNLLMLAGPLFMLQVYDRVIPARSEETLVALFLLVSGLFLLMAVLDYARGRVLARVGARFQTALDGRVFEATLRRTANPAERGLPASSLRDIDAVQQFFASPVLLALMDMPWTPFFIAAIFIFHPLLGWAAVGGGLILVALTLGNQILTAQRGRRAQVAQQQALFFAEQVRTGAEVVLSQGMRGAMGARWRQKRIEALAESLTAADLTGSFSSVSRTFRLYLQSLMLALGAWLLLKGEVTSGAMVASSIMLGRALAPIEQALGQWPLVQRAQAGWKSLAAYLGATPQHPPLVSLPVPAARLAVRGLMVSAPGTRTPTLRNISFDLNPGQALGVIGPSGSGKSTLARALLGYWPLASGEIRLDGATLDQYDPDALGRHIGYLPQSVSLFSATVAENIARMSPQPDAAAIISAAKRANAHEMILRLPEGYGTRIDGTEAQLSGGQRQRIALARALYADPVLLILDEPNSALDADGSEALNRAVRELKAAGKSVIIMTHRPAAIAECDFLLVMEGGTIVTGGPRDEVLARSLRNAGMVQGALQQREGKTA